MIYNTDSAKCDVYAPIDWEISVVRKTLLEYLTPDPSCGRSYLVSGRGAVTLSGAGDGFFVVLGHGKRIRNTLEDTIMVSPLTEMFGREVTRVGISLFRTVRPAHWPDLNKAIENMGHDREMALFFFLKANFT